MPTAVALKSRTRAVRRSRRRARATLPALAFAIVAAGLSSCTSPVEDEGGQNRSSVIGGDRDRGKATVERLGCGSCHVIPGIRSAQGHVGPPLDGIAKRSYVGGALPNTPSNMVSWIQHPRRIDPQTAMPDLGLTEAEARDVAAYLYSLK